MEDVRVTRLINGPEAFTPDNEFCLGETEVRGPLRRRPASARTAWPAPAASARSWPSGSSPASRALDVWADGHPALRRALPARRVHAGARPRGLRDLLRHPLPRPRAPGGPAAAASRSAYAWHARARRRVRREVGLGARQLVRRQRRRGRRGAAPARLGGAALVAGDRGRAPRRPRARRAVRRVVVRQARGRRPGRRGVPGARCATTASRARSGAITYTQMLNGRGGIECDFTVTRLAEDALPHRHRHRVRPARPGLAPRATRRATGRCAVERRHRRAGRASRCGARAPATSSRR